MRKLWKQNQDWLMRCCQLCLWDVFRVWLCKHNYYNFVRLMAACDTCHILQLLTLLPIFTMLPNKGNSMKIIPLPTEWSNSSVSDSGE